MLDFGGRKDTDAPSRRGSMPLSARSMKAGPATATLWRDRAWHQDRCNPPYFARQAHRHTRSA